MKFFSRNVLVIQLVGLNEKPPKNLSKNFRGLFDLFNRFFMLKISNIVCRAINLKTYFKSTRLAKFAENVRGGSFSSFLSDDGS